jgi:phosphate:Na+ symporter
MATSFAAAGLVQLVPALAIMLGANVGMTLIVQILSFNVVAAAPVLFVIGLVAFRGGARTRIKDLGRVAIGLGLMLLALHILLDTLAPAEEAPGVHNRRSDDVHIARRHPYLGGAFERGDSAAHHVACFFAFHHPHGSARIGLGANLGSAVNPLLEGGHRDDPTSYRLPAGNLLNRLVGVLLVTPFLHPVANIFQAFQPDMAKMTAEFHVAFNVMMALLFIGLLDPLARLLERIFPAKKQASNPFAPRYLDENAVDTPMLALADAARETLRMGDTVETMLRQVMVALMTNNRGLVSEVSRMDNIVDHLDEAIKLYVTKLTRGSLDDREGRRAMEIISFAFNLEHIGDIIDKNLCEVAAKKIKRKLQFSNDGAAELEAFHKRVLDSLRMAFAVFMSGNVNEARKLIAEKAALRNAELAAAERHLERLREGRPETLETTSLHLDVLRDLKRIHSHICSVAYPVLEAAGELPAANAAESASSAPGAKPVLDE